MGPKLIPVSSYATAGIALNLMRAHKPVGPHGQCYCKAITPVDEDDNIVYKPNAVYYNSISF